MFLLEAYKIPTPSMEGSLLVGDFLFVSKAHYGIRTPMTVAMFPLLHNTIPFLGSESYLEKPSLPYFRLPALESIDRNEPIVFNWPVGDSVYLSPTRSYTAYQVKTNEEAKRDVGNAPLITRPIDKKDHYIKRCIAIAGDSLEVRDRQVYINGAPAENPKNLQFIYQIYSKGLNWKKVEEMGITIPANKILPFYLSEKHIAELKKMDPNIKIEPFDMTPSPFAKSLSSRIPKSKSNPRCPIRPPRASCCPIRLPAASRGNIRSRSRPTTGLKSSLTTASGSRVREVLELPRRPVRSFVRPGGPRMCGCGKIFN
jgi:signal peptidase I